MHDATADALRGSVMSLKPAVIRGKNCIKHAYVDRDSKINERLWPRLRRTRAMRLLPEAAINGQERATLVQAIYKMSGPSNCCSAAGKF